MNLIIFLLQKRSFIIISILFSLCSIATAKTTNTDSSIKPNTLDQNPSLIYISKGYSANLIEEEISGTVMLRVTISSKTDAQKIEILNSTEPKLNDTAVTMAKDARYKPLIVSSKAVQSVVNFPISFRL